MSALSALPRLATLALSLLVGACAGIPEGLRPVSGFQADRYLGRWYEIARLDHAFERGLQEVTAEYRRLPDGRIEVVNRGYDPQARRWREAQGVARFAGPEDLGSLEVSFFGPFWGGYNVLALDEAGYSWALVAGPTRGYLWILARTPALDPAVRARLVERARGWGFATDTLIFVEHGGAPPVRLAPAAGSK